MSRAETKTQTDHRRKEGDDWFHQVQVERIDQAIPTVNYPRVIRRVGNRPPILRFGDITEVTLYQRSTDLSTNRRGLIGPRRLKLRIDLSGYCQEAVPKSVSRGRPVATTSDIK